MFYITWINEVFNRQLKMMETIAAKIPVLCVQFLLAGLWNRQM